MKVVCKKRDNSGYYSNITPEKEYESIPYSQLGHDGNMRSYFIIVDDINCKGYFLKEYFYSTEEVRQRKLDQLMPLN